MKGQVPWSERVSRVVMVVASAWFAFAAAWGLFGIPGDGHLGAGSAGNVMAAEQIVRWKSLYPAFDWYSGSPPSKAAYLCHHPEGQYYIPAFFLWVFGHRNFVVHLPAALMSAAMPPMLYGIAKERWGAPMGAVAAAAYSVVPIAVGFSSFMNLETVAIFGVLLFFWGHSRHMKTGAPRHLIASLVGMLFACSGDWAGYLIVAPVLAWACLRAFVLPVWATPRFRALPYGRWWALSVSVAALTLVYWIALFHHADALKDWLGAGGMRSSGSELPLREVLRSRKTWIYFSFTPLAVRLGVIAAPVCLLRLLVTRLDEEVYAPAILFGAVVQYVKFKEGADVHIFWPHYFAPYFALALAQLATAVASCTGWIVGRFAEARAAAVTAGVGLALGLMPVIAMAHDGVASLWVWRRTGGRYSDNGTLIYSHIDTLQVIQEVVVPKSLRGTTIDIASLRPVVLAALLERPGQRDDRGGSGCRGRRGSDAPVLARPFEPALDRRGGEDCGLVARPRVRADVGRRPAGAPGSDRGLLDERARAESVRVARLRRYGAHAQARQHARPLAHVGAAHASRHGRAAAVGRAAHAGRDSHRAQRRDRAGDGPAAARWRQRIDEKLDRSVTVQYDRGVNLIGVRLTDGVEPRIETWFECTGPMGDGSFNVRSTMEKQARFSLIPPDPTDREMALGPLLPTKLWRVGMI